MLKTRRHSPADITAMKLACIIRYQIDLFQRENFKKHAENLIAPVPRCGGHLFGFFTPHEGTNDVCWALLLCESLADYEAYRNRVANDPDARADAMWMHDNRVILREERNLVELVDGTFDLPSALEREEKSATQLVCIIRYQIDPFKRAEFKKHAENLVTVVPNAGGHLLGYFLPDEGTNDIAWGLIGFESLTAYEAYRARLTVDRDAVQDATWTRDQRCILREERNFVALVDGTFNLAPSPV
jgi:hypothetical protein